MNTIAYLKEIYGYSTPIFLKDIRIGGKSKTSIRKDLSRAVEKGEIVHKAQGIYCFKGEHSFIDGLTFENILYKKYIQNDYDIPGLDIDTYGYYTGLSFMNSIGLTQQVPAILEIVTNNTSCTRVITINNRKAILRKGKIEINRYNYKALQLFDLFYSLNKEDVKENYELLFNYIEKNIPKISFEKYIGLYPIKIMKLIIEGGLLDAFR